ncbi:PREDICTED: uncharacterized protein LOC104798612 [Tarenaya hassleriana]|uniref:uncharacterized protein LOC104798612 n=1 Tax=Tarenaya hassleriana TaxID=28532 RepID=UPI00053C49D7|nr:PREDICTED: uncharacterized protein LOC104798612 [Tarenaya hassleriana]
MTADEEFEKFVRDFQESEERNAKILEQYYAGGLNYHYYPFEASGHYAAAAYQPYYTSSATYPYGSYWYPLQPAWHYPQPHYAMFPPAPAGEDMVGKGIAAAQKAISSLRINADGGDAKTETGEGEEEEMTTGSATELHEVLNAWYTAGLYTGKYLTEQASLKNAN